MVRNRIGLAPANNLCTLGRYLYVLRASWYFKIQKFEIVPCGRLQRVLKLLVHLVLLVWILIPANMIEVCDCRREPNFFFMRLATICSVISTFLWLSSNSFKDKQSEMHCETLWNLNLFILYLRQPKSLEWRSSWTLKIIQSPFKRSLSSLTPRSSRVAVSYWYYHCFKFIMVAPSSSKLPFNFFPTA